MEREPLYKTAIVLGAIALSTGAFSWKTRQIIKERDGNKCVICGSTTGCECAHIDHDRQKPTYDDPSNGRLLCTEDHLKDHINRHGRNGLTKIANEKAIELIKKRLPTVIYHSDEG